MQHCCIFYNFGSKLIRLKSIYSVSTTTMPAEFKDADSKKGIVTGYFASFNNKDSDGDIIVKGAFAKSIGDMGPGSAKPRIKHLLNHNPEQPLGVIKTLTEDSKGLYYESQIGNHALGQDFIKMVESGLVSEHSIGFRIIDSGEGKDLGFEDARVLKAIQLWEGSSLTAWGANDRTPLTGLKSMQDLSIDKLLEKQKRIEKFCKDTDATDETIELLLLHSKQLSQIILDITTKQDETTLQEEKRLADILTTFKNTLK